MAIADANAAVEYARCKNKAAELVRIYNDIRQELINFQEAKRREKDQ